MTKLQILQIQTQAEAGGAQRVSDMLADGLRAQGNQVCTVFMYRKTAAYDADPHAIFVAQARPAGLLHVLAVMFRLIRVVRSQKPDVVITYQLYGNLIGALAGRLSSAKIVIANQSGNPGQRGLRRLASFLDHAFGVLGVYDCIIVNSAATEAAYRRNSRIYAKRLRRIDHGVAPPKILVDKHQARATFRLPEAARLLVSTGRLAPGKNQEVLIRALRLLPDAHLALAGAGPDREHLERAAVELKVSDRVHFVGELNASEVGTFLQAGDVFAFASNDETFGLSIAEASVAGLPVVTSDMPVLREVLTTKEGRPAALFFPVGDHESLAKAVTALFANDSLAQQLRDTGRTLAERYAPDRMTAEYSEVIASNCLRN